MLPGGVLERVLGLGRHCRWAEKLEARSQIYSGSASHCVSQLGCGVQDDYGWALLHGAPFRRGYLVVVLPFCCGAMSSGLGSVEGEQVRVKDVMNAW